jgi:uncharacterized protein
MGSTSAARELLNLVASVPGEMVRLLRLRHRPDTWGAANDHGRDRARRECSGSVAIRIDERYVVRAPVARVWDFLVDPRRVVACVPGGELTSVRDDRTFDGRIRVAVGPLTFAYAGRVQLAEVDAAGRRVTIVGTAREREGTDSARLTLESWLAPHVDGATEVIAHARVDVAGRIVELGRGFLERLGHVVFQRFASAVQASVEAELAGGAAGARAAQGAPAQPVRAIPLVLLAVKAWAADWMRARVPAHGPPRAERRARERASR